MSAFIRWIGKNRLLAAFGAVALVLIGAVIESGRDQKSAEDAELSMLRSEKLFPIVKDLPDIPEEIDARIARAEELKLLWNSQVARRSGSLLN